MKQTAVQWLFDKIEEIEFQDPAAGQFYQEVICLKDQAKQMEKEQIIDAFSLGVINHHDAFKNENKFGNGKQYYNETFKSE